ncbi:MAG: helix-turn-helix transcriptional regulator [Gemmatimonadota bacterium]|jgi:PadR family transcriptional regulator PadR
MPKGQNLGEAEHLVLLAAFRLGADATGADIRDEVARRTGRDLTVSAVYVTLLRLERKGMVTSELGDPTPVRGGKARRHFTVSPHGVELLYDARERFDRMWEGLGPAPTGDA